MHRWKLNRQLSSLDRWLAAEVAARDDLDGLCALVFQYLCAGHLRHRGAGKARVSYPGRTSSNGVACDQMEGFTRLAPLFAAWVASGRDPVVELPLGEQICVRSVLAEGLREGTRPDSPGYWGAITGPDQRVCEAADVALATWLARDALARELGARDLDRLFDWLAGACRADVRDNNWHLFPLLVDAVSRAFGREGLGPAQREFHTGRILAMHLGDGWFRDGTNGPIDYYNSWGFRYSLYWLDRIGYPLGGIPYQEFAQPFFDDFKWLFTPQGFPVFGRSVCYRMAAPAGLLTAALCTRAPGDLGLALHAVESTWRHFLARGALARGGITPGYYRRDWRLLDGYSGPASPLWSLRSLIPLLAEPAGSPAWTTSPMPLPVEVEDFVQRLELPGWQVEGDSNQGRVDVTFLGGTRTWPRPAQPTLRKRARRLLDRLLGRSFGRPLQELAYRQPRYTSAYPFWESDRGHNRPR